MEHNKSMICTHGTQLKLDWDTGCWLVHPSYVWWKYTNPYTGDILCVAFSHQRFGRIFDGSLSVVCLLYVSTILHQHSGWACTEWSCWCPYKIFPKRKGCYTLPICRSYSTV